MNARKKNSRVHLKGLLPFLMLVIMPFVALAVVWPVQEAYSMNLTLGWDPSPAPELEGYRVYYGTASGDYPNVINVGNWTSMKVSGLDPHTTYYFVATAYGASGEESVHTNEAVYTPSTEAEEELIISDTPNGAWHLAYNNGRKRQAQTFKSLGNSIDSVTIPIIRVKNPNIPINVSIRTSLVGPPLASAAIEPSRVSSTDYRNPTWVTVTFPAPAEVTQGLNYYLVLETTSYNVSHYYKVCYDNRNPYADGVYYPDNRSVALSGYDMACRIKFGKLN